MASLSLLAMLLLPLLQSGGAVQSPECSQPVNGANLVSGVDVRGKAVAPADLPEATASSPTIGDNVTLDLILPPSRYSENPLLADPLAAAELNAGSINIKRDGSTQLNGQDLGCP